jgi:hypothetical protein
MAAVGAAAGIALAAADFGRPGAPAPPNFAAVSELLQRDGHDLELLISFGTSRGGSAGHLALAVSEPGHADDTVYSANFYADRDAAHESEYYTRDLMVAIPKMEYLYGTKSSLDPKASFGLDFGEVYKRSVIGIRVSGVPESQKKALVAFFARLNADFHRRAHDTEYHRGEVRYNYTRLNCAKTIGSAFKYGAGYGSLRITSAGMFSELRVVAAARSNVPTEMAMRLVDEWHARGYHLDVVFYRKYRGSAHVDPHDKDAIAFKDLPDRFPSVISRDFRSDPDRYKDFDNLYAMYLLYNLGSLALRVDDLSHRIEVERTKQPLAFELAARRAERAARDDARLFRRGQPFRPEGHDLEEDDVR